MSLTLAQLLSEITTQFPNNTSGAITPTVMRQMLNDIVNSDIINNTNIGLTRAQAIATNFSTPPAAIRTTGYYTLGDGGGGLHVKVSPAPTSHTAYFTTADGSVYTLVPEDATVNLLQFGAKPMLDFATMPTVGGDQDSYFAFVAADKFIASYSGGIKLVIPMPTTGQPWFMGRTHSLYRCNYEITGHGFTSTFIRTPPYESGFVVGSGFGILDYNFVDPNNTYALGFGAIKRAGQPGQYNCYRCIVGGTVSASDDILVDAANNPSATYTWGTSQWKFERFVGPGSVWDYSATPNGVMNMVIRQLSFWSFWQGRTLPDFGGGFGGSSDPAFNKWPNQDLDVSGQPQYRCGILLRNRSNIEYVQTLQYNGFGLAASAVGDPELPNAVGNTDGYHFNHIYSYYNGKAGVHDCGSISNAGNSYYIDTASNGRMGVEAFSFLGNNYYGIQSASDGFIFHSNKQYLSGATYNGTIWFPRLSLKGSESVPPYINEEPGSSSNHAWTRWFDDSAGVRGTVTGSVSGTVLTVTAGSVGIAIGDMISSSASGTNIRPGTKILTLGTGTGGTGTYNLTGAAQTVTSRTITIMNGTYYLSDQFQPWDPTFQYEWGGAFGSNSANARNYWSGNYQEGGVSPGQLGNLDVAIGGMAQSVDATRGGTLLDANGKWNNLKSFVFQFADTGKRIVSRTAVPIAGDSASPFFQGDIALISNSTTGSPAAYYCKAGGDPGTWVVWGGNLP